MNIITKLVNYIRCLFAKRTPWFPLEWTEQREHAALRKLFPMLKGAFQKPDASRVRPYRRLFRTGKRRHRQLGHRAGTSYGKFPLKTWGAL